MIKEQIQSFQKEMGLYNLCRRGYRKSKKIPKQSMDEPIDFVVTWVDGDDPSWREERDRYAAQMGMCIHKNDAANGEARTRDWNIFRYWFRAVEKYAPWVRKVHLVTCGQVPEWLDIHSPKLNVVFHKDYIPEKYLPTFSSVPIVLNLHRIEGLSEHFVYINDDMFLNRSVYPEDFFQGGNPNHTAISKSHIPLNSSFNYMFFATVGEINRAFYGKLNKVMIDHPEKWFAAQYGDMLYHNKYAFKQNALTGLYISHLGIPRLKSTMNKVWEALPALLDETCSHRFRTNTDVISMIFDMWNMMENRFEPVAPGHYGKMFSDPPKQIEEIVETIANERYRMICINDCEAVTQEDYLYLKKILVETFEHTFPHKSVYEK